jgi:hypothetical protein
MNGILKCYMFRLPQNHYQTIRSEPVKHTAVLQVLTLHFRQISLFLFYKILQTSRYSVTLVMYIFIQLFSLSFLLLYLDKNFMESKILYRYECSSDPVIQTQQVNALNEISKAGVNSWKPILCGNVKF